ncbi:hypothetical protein V2B08_30900, partial [Pseudomonas aeruginosa]
PRGEAPPEPVLPVGKALARCGLASGVVLALDKLNAVFIRVSIRNVYFRLHGEGAGAQGLGIRPARQELR